MRTAYLGRIDIEVSCNVSSGARRRVARAADDDRLRLGANGCSGN